MITKNIFIDSVRIGTVHFFAYVFNNTEGQVGFGLFPDDGPQPIYYILADPGKKAKLHFNEELILQICQHSTYTTQQRRALFRDFLAYSSSLEKKMAKSIFRRAKASFLADSREVVHYKRLYIHYPRK